jgi:hypothetical protein
MRVMPVHRIEPLRNNKKKDPMIYKKKKKNTEQKIDSFSRLLDLYA